MKMRKDTFQKLMDRDYKYLNYSDVERMSNEQRAEYRKAHNPYVIWCDEDGDNHYTKLNEFVNEDGTYHDPWERGINYDY